MASPPEDGQPQSGQKTLHVWAKPVEQKDDAPTSEKGPDGTGTTSSRPTISKAVSMIKKDDFTNVANIPCARQGFLVGIGSGAGVGGLKFVLSG